MKSNLTPVLLGLLAFVLACGVGGSDSPATPPLPADAFVNFPADTPRPLDLAVEEDVLKGLTARERLDQVRDWLLLTVLSDSRLPAPEMNRILFDMPTARRRFLRPVASYEYGETRSRLIAEDKVLALIPAAAGDDRRADLLAHVADEHRKNNGDIPGELLVFEYSVDLGRQSGEIVRRETVEAAKLFTPESGYHESQIDSLADLTRLLSQIDDLTYAHDDGRLTLGGRKIKGHAYRGLKVEDVAALWISERNIQRALSDGAAGSDTSPLVGGSGFSLDPFYDFDELEVFFDKLLAQMRAAGVRTIGAEEARRIRLALREKDEIPLLTTVARLKESADPREALTAELLNAVVTAHRYQAARYDGDLQATEVGMTLFYTDLLAKLWDFDFAGSAPRDIPDFRAEIALSLSPVHREELKKFPSARLWFGHNEDGYQVADEGASLLFARNSTRLFAKSNNPLDPQKEVESDAATAEFIGWWDDHFEEVARHEPQYERLNQIMKWSLVLGWLNSNEQGARLDFLAGVNTSCSNCWFPDWVKAHPELRFQKWDEVKFLARGEKGTTTEAMPVLISEPFARWGEEWTLSGGVSLANRFVFNARRILTPSRIDNKLVRRSNLESFSKVGGGEEIKTAGGASHMLRGSEAERALLTSTPREGAHLRDAFGSYRQRMPFTREISRRGPALEVETGVDGTPLGRLSVSHTGNGFKIGWRSRDFDTGHALARRMSVHRDPAAVLTADANVIEAVRLPSGAYMVRLRGSENGRWLKLTPGANRLPASGGSSSVSGLRVEARPYEVEWVGESTLAHHGRLTYLRRANVPAPTEAAVPVAELRRSNQFIAEGEAVKAINHLDELAARYGPQPELTLRKGLAQLIRGRGRDSADTLAEAIGTPPERGLVFLDEVSRRIKLLKLTPEGETLSLVTREGGAVLRYELPSLGKLRPASPAQIDVNRALVYVQDSPRLSNLDWTTSPRQSLHQAVSFGLGRVYRLPRGDVARFRPAVIQTADGGNRQAVSLNAAQRLSLPSGVRSPWPFVIAAAAAGVDDEEETEVYVVLAAGDVR